MAIKIGLPEKNVYAGIANMILADIQSKGQEIKADLMLREALHKVSHWLSNEETKDRKWLMMFGKSGDGKSTALRAVDALIKRLHDEGWTHLCKFSWKYITASDLHNVYLSDRATFNGIMNYNLLLIDDLGVEPLFAYEYGNELRPIVDMFNYRYDNRNERNLSMMFTTNIEPNDIEKRYGSRVFSRFCETCQSVKFGETDYRTIVKWTETEKGVPF